MVASIAMRPVLQLRLTSAGEVVGVAILCESSRIPETHWRLHAKSIFEHVQQQHNHTANFELHNNRQMTSIPCL